MTEQKTKHVTGGNEDGVGIAQDVRISSFEKNDKKPASEAGKILPQEKTLPIASKK